MEALAAQVYADTGRKKDDVVAMRITVTNSDVFIFCFLKILSYNLFAARNLVGFKF